MVSRDDYDVPEVDVVATGVGQDSLIAAAYLAKAGLGCVVLEARPVD